MVRALLLAFAGYALLAATTITMTSDGRDHATVWPADAVVLALLLLMPRRHWPMLLAAGWLGNLLGNALTRDWSFGIVLYGAINMGQTFLAATLIDRHDASRGLLSDGRATLRFLLMAGLLAPAMGALLGSIVSLASYGEPFIPSFLRWYTSNALGFLIGAPFFKAVFDGSYWACLREKSPSGRFEGFALLVLHASVLAVVFCQSTLPILFLPMSSLLLLAFRLGKLGAVAGVIMVAAAGATAGYFDVGPVVLIRHSPAIQAIFFQVYLGTILCTALPVAAIVSSLAEAHNRLTEQRLVLQQILSQSPDGVLTFDMAGTCHWADGRLSEQLGLDSASLVGKSLDELSEMTSDRLADLVAGALETGGEAVGADFEPVGRPGTILEASVGVLETDGARSGVVVTLRDITKRKQRETAMVRMVETDDLTGVLNRKGFRSHLTPALVRHDGPLVLALIDVDHFKMINDQYGHSVGDEVLKEIAARLSAGSRSTDLVGRLGGDEFAILFRCDLPTARKACERIAAAIRNQPVHRHGKLGVLASISCGLAEYRDGMTRGELFDAADMALYDVKRTGRDGVSTAPDTSVRLA